MNDSYSPQLVSTQRSLVRIECLKAAMQLCKIDAAVAPDEVSAALDKILPVAARLEKLTENWLEKAIPSA